jgi:hypothetical protein
MRGNPTSLQGDLRVRGVLVTVPPPDRSEVSGVPVAVRLAG